MKSPSSGTNSSQESVHSNKPTGQLLTPRDLQAFASVGAPSKTVPTTEEDRRSSEYHRNAFELERQLRTHTRDKVHSQLLSYKLKNGAATRIADHLVAVRSYVHDSTHRLVLEFAVPETEGTVMIKLQRFRDLEDGDAGYNLIHLTSAAVRAFQLHEDDVLTLWTSIT